MICAMADVDSSRVKGPEAGGVAPTYPDEVFLEILRRHAEGELIIKILQDPGAPSWGTFYERVRGPNASDLLKAADKAARGSYAAQKGEELMFLSDEDPIVAFSKLDPGDKEVVRVDSAAVAWQKLRVDTRKWLVSKVLPALYGERTIVQNPDGTPLAVPALVIVATQPKEAGDA